MLELPTYQPDVDPEKIERAKWQSAYDRAYQRAAEEREKQAQEKADQHIREMQAALAPATPTAEEQERDRLAKDELMQQWARQNERWAAAKAALKAYRTAQLKKLVESESV